MFETFATLNNKKIDYYESRNIPMESDEKYHSYHYFSCLNWKINVRLWSSDILQLLLLFCSEMFLDTLERK